MGDFLSEWYLWIKALHVVSVMSWMAGLLYLPRLFVYHCNAPVGSDMSETFKVMERRLLRAIMNPAMLASWLLGVLLWMTPGVILVDDRWFGVKLAAVIGLTGVHMAMGIWRKAFAEDRNTHSPRFYRAANEVPTLLMVVIVVMVFVRPF